MNHTTLDLRMNRKNGDYEINYHGFPWVSDGRRPYLIIRHKIGKKYAYTYRSFGSARQKDIQQDGRKIISTFSGFTAFGKTLDFKLICTAEITGPNTVEFSLRTENETGMDIHAVYFPAPFNSKTKGESSYAVDTMRQGFLMPDGYKKNFLSTFGFAHYLRKINTGDCYMPFWGRVCDGHGFCAIVETPFDASYFSSFGKRLSFLNSVSWRSSLGRLGYERKIKFIFHDDCDYNTLAKDYRAYLEKTGQLVTITDKIRKNPNIEKLVGTPVLHCGIFSNIQPGTGFYKEGGENQKLIASFAQRAEQYRKIREAGLETLYIHTDGWGEMGYDNSHPYVLPPCPQAGGYEGMKRLSDTCRELNYIFAIHDQYRDYYYSCKKYDPTLSVTNIDGTHPYCDYWAGGAHSWLCASQALGFLQETYQELEAHGVDIQGAYLDVFAVVPGDECFDPAHKITREQSIRYRAECFDYLNGKGVITSSEEPASQLVNHLALVHHGPYTLRPQERGKAVGIPVPLASLVYHDCIMIPWISKGVGGWGIPEGDSARLHCLLNAGMPYFEPFDQEDRLLPEPALKEEIHRVQELCAVQARLFDKEMVSHKFLDQGMRRQQTVYADGTVITVDFDQNTYQIEEQTPC